MAAAVGRRIQQLREEAGFTSERLAYESDVAKGYLSDVENGNQLPSLETLQRLADGLGVLPLDFLTFPEGDARQELIDCSRNLREATLRRLLREASPRQK